MIYYHGTSKFSARRILQQGFAWETLVSESLKHRHLAKHGITRIKFGGLLGDGVYVTRNWKAALHFGPVLFRVEIAPGSKILNLKIPPDTKIIDRLKREFSHEILRKHPIKVIPRNKRLTMDEAIQLARYHYHRIYNSTSVLGKWEESRARLIEIRSLVTRFGIHGWGESTDLDGISLFAADRIKPREVVLSLPTRELAEACNNYERTDPPHHSLDAIIQIMHRAPGPAAANTRQWVQAANRILAT